MRRTILTAMTTITLLALSVPALAHVTVQPSEATTGSFSRFDVRVPNEREDTATTTVQVQFPDNVTNVSFQPKEGWERTVTMKTLDEPIIVFGGEVTEVIDTVTWEGGMIEPGEFDEFGFTARTPDDAGELAFPAIQTYDDGEEVPWTGPADGDEPAPRVTTAAAPSDEGTASEEAASEEAASEEAASEGPSVTATESEPSGADTSTEAAEPDDDGGSTQATIALVLAALALVVAIGGMVLASRRD